MEKTKIIIAGTTVTFVSPHTLDQLRKVENYSPEALVLRDENNNPQFVLSAGQVGAIETAYATYADSTPDDNALACISMGLPCCGGKKATEVVADIYGPMVVKMNQIEGQIEKALHTVNDMLRQVESDITVATM